MVWCIAISAIALGASLLTWRYADNDWVRSCTVLSICLFAWLLMLSGAARLSAELRKPWHGPFNSLMVLLFTALGVTVFFPAPVRFLSTLAVDDPGVFGLVPDIILARSVELAVGQPPSITQVVIVMVAATAAYFATAAISRDMPFLMFALTAASVSFALTGAFVVVLAVNGVATVFAMLDKTGRTPMPEILELQSWAGGFLRLYALCIVATYAAIVARLWRLWPAGSR